MAAIVLKEKYDNEIIPQMMKELGYKNKWAVPRIEKIVINIGLGEGGSNPKLLDTAITELGQITGRRGIKTKAKKSIANFKLREGMSIGCMVTLRGRAMYEFFYRLISISLPRVRDFRGLSPKSFDGYGNYTMGIKEQIIFPEINYDKIEKAAGMNITLITTAKTDEEARELLKLFGMPFRK
ncbi:50S ribosomal protein L5 [Candidatus Desantisbacteria bacterium]|nr:50S ribosomal protein L5 [Candidatus Desantisbacteria bacterium]